MCVPFINKDMETWYRNKLKQISVSIKCFTDAKLKENVFVCLCLLVTTSRGLLVGLLIDLATHQLSKCNIDILKWCTINVYVGLKSIESM